MKALFQLKTLSVFVYAILMSSMLMAQKEKPASPHLGVKGTVAGANISIRYGSPYVKGRKIWGGLEPYGKVYRAGADSATTFTTDKAITVEGKALPAGKYSFFVIPVEKGQWTVIFNKTAEQWGAFEYKEAQDQLRVMVTPKKHAMSESLTYVITKKGFSMDWDKISIPVSIK
ncbi:DUF2911 domain-containing protein [Mucilaginibacter sp. OK098]|uniref:DUF2911 domain-containing protein n=1 Tax=Mucilaginibacter sp. OK098 TaxID=1855297 RepID=UPI000918E3E1|nr:DUF2911 domain-containing protein [Mucilaginibacter sp. OK098]SHM54888.1 Protein of unknown function [Mucilaginibacter sp. OK098]